MPTPGMDSGLAPRPQHDWRHLLMYQLLKQASAPTLQPGARSCWCCPAPGGSGCCGNRWLQGRLGIAAASTPDKPAFRYAGADELIQLHGSLREATAQGPTLAARASMWIHDPRAAKLSDTSSRTPET